jgi:hypothetical protein
MTEFYDSARWDLIPGHADALLYGDGLYKVTAGQARRFKAVRWITVFGDPGCGAADYEQGNPVFGEPGALKRWVAGRKEMGCRARVYTDLSNLPAAYRAVGGSENVVWWIATLDGDRRTLAQTAELVKRSAPLDPKKIWALQYWGGMTAPYDKSVLYGAW